MSKIKVGSRVVFTSSRRGLGVRKGDKATLCAYLNDKHGLVFVNTDKLNLYNHPDHNGNGLHVLESRIELLKSIGPWSSDEIDYLHQNYKRKSIEEISSHLKRSYFSVQSKARSEGLHKYPRRTYNDRDNRFIRHTYMDNWKLTEIGRQLHRSKSSIEGRIALMNKRGLLPSIPKEID